MELQNCAGQKFPTEILEGKFERLKVPCGASMYLTLEHIYILEKHLQSSFLFNTSTFMFSNSRLLLSCLCWRTAACHCHLLIIPKSIWYIHICALFCKTAWMQMWNEDLKVSSSFSGEGWGMNSSRIISAWFLHVSGEQSLFKYTQTVTSDPSGTDC